MTSTLECPNCGKPHSLFWIVVGNGQRKLHITCDRVSVQGKDKHGDVGISYQTHDIVVHTPFLAAQHKNDVSIPVRWSAQWRRKQQEKQECNLQLKLS